MCDPEDNGGNEGEHYSRAEMVECNRHWTQLLTKVPPTSEV